MYIYVTSNNKLQIGLINSISTLSITWAANAINLPETISTSISLSAGLNNLYISINGNIYKVNLKITPNSTDDQTISRPGYHRSGTTRTQSQYPNKVLIANSKNQVPDNINLTIGDYRIIIKLAKTMLNCNGTIIFYNQMIKEIFKNYERDVPYLINSSINNSWKGTGIKTSFIATGDDVILTSDMKSLNGGKSFLPINYPQITIGSPVVINTDGISATIAQNNICNFAASLQDDTITWNLLTSVQTDDKVLSIYHSDGIVMILVKNLTSYTIYFYNNINSSLNYTTISIPTSTIPYDNLNKFIIFNKGGVYIYAPQSDNQNTIVYSTLDSGENWISNTINIWAQNFSYINGLLLIGTFISSSINGTPPYRNINNTSQTLNGMLFYKNGIAAYQTLSQSLWINTNAIYQKTTGVKVNYPNKTMTFTLPIGISQSLKTFLSLTNTVGKPILQAPLSFTAVYEYE